MAKKNKIDEELLDTPVTTPAETVEVATAEQVETPAVTQTPTEVLDTQTTVTPQSADDAYLAKRKQDLEVDLQNLDNDLSDSLNVVNEYDRRRIPTVDVPALEEEETDVKSMRELNKERRIANRKAANEQFKENIAKWQEELANNRKDRQANREERMNRAAEEAVDLVVRWTEATGEKLSEESLASLLTPEQLWYFQKKYNKGSNFGNALGGRAFFGNLNNDTVRLLNDMADQKIKAKNEVQKEKDEVGVTVDYGANKINITKSMVDDMKRWGNQIKDPNNISPEMATALYEKLQSYGITTPTAVTEPMSIYNLVESVVNANQDANAEMVMETLGFDNGNDWQVPHDESFEEKLAKRKRAQDELNYINQQRELERKKARLGLAELGASIGDWIKGSNGAVVNPRDYQAMYDSLTAQQQKNYNFYLARMEALKNEELLKKERLYKEKQDQIQRDWTSAEYEKNRQAELLAASVKAGATSGKESVDTAFNGKKYTFKNKDTYTSAMHSIFGIIKNAITDAKGNLKPPYSTTFANLDGKVPQSEIYSVIAAAAMDTPAIRKQYGKQINETLKAYTGIAGNPIKEEETSETVTTTTTGKKYRNAQGVEISEEEYNNLSILVKPLYQEVK